MSRLSGNEVRVKITKAPIEEVTYRQFDFNSLEWHAHGALGYLGLDDASRDLIELSRLIVEIEKYNPKRVSTQRIREVVVNLSLRRPELWTEEALGHLSSAIRLMSNSKWTFKIRLRPKSLRTSLDCLAEAVKIVSEEDCKRLSNAALFSAGLDSTCGLAWLKQRDVAAVLVSVYGPKAKQDKIRASFGFEDSFQITSKWLSNSGRFGGQFQLRSLLFLCIGAAVSNSYGLQALYQFENGPLSLALPPAGTYRMTRHAHPKVHSELGSLFSLILRPSFELSNPFLLLTKREAVQILSDCVNDQSRLREMLRFTETCWNLNSRIIMGNIDKTNGQACGVCIPCLVRGTALTEDPVATRANFKSKIDPLYRLPEARVHVDALIYWAEKFLSPSYSVEQFSYDAPLPIRAALKAYPDFLDSDKLFKLYRRYAEEIRTSYPPFVR